MRSLRALLVGPLARADAWHRREISAWLRRGPAWTVAVDGGLERAARLGLAVDWAVGDWDSLRDRGRLREVMHLTLPRAKDRSDLHYAMRTALNAGASDILCVGFLGGPRWDQHQATVAELADFSERARVTAIGEGHVFEFLSRWRPKWIGRLPKGAVVSIFALDRAWGVSTLGLRYRLKDSVLVSGSLGLSNEVVGGNAAVRIAGGRLVVVRSS